MRDAVVRLKRPHSSPTRRSLKAGFRRIHWPTACPRRRLPRRSARYEEAIECYRKALECEARRARRRSSEPRQCLLLPESPRGGSGGSYRRILSIDPKYVGGHIGFRQRAVRPGAIPRVDRVRRPRIEHSTRTTHSLDISIPRPDDASLARRPRTRLVGARVANAAGRLQPPRLHAAALGRLRPQRQDDPSACRTGFRRQHPVPPIRGIHQTRRRSSDHRRFARPGWAARDLPLESTASFPSTSRCRRWTPMCRSWSLPHVFKGRRSPRFRRTFRICFPTRSESKRGEANWRRSARSRSASSGREAGSIAVIASVRFPSTGSCRWQRSRASDSTACRRTRPTSRRSR